MDTFEIVLIVGCAVLAVAAVVFAAMYFSLKSKISRHIVKAGKVKVIHGVRYSQDNVVSDGNGYHVSYLPGDAVLKRGAEYTALKNGALKPGTYTVLSGGTEFKFNIRHGGIVREYMHGDKIVIAEGERICAVSDSVILR